ncbi:PrpF domain-containing protein [Corynebacterium comes]|uniref:3-methylitaconate isomerase n=1 Tax=Corynebacterium comes TaxID=2675218 RepID=A0A6B8W3K3_9CORY|nr:PrpF domain-containing protein [Corynebacterium comes]QGU04400.1 3-methylitaconate isomerase [Corynebacterium comes]
MSTVPVSIVRGGTSRAVFLPMSELPADTAARDELCLRLIGSPDPVAVDGLGGGVSSNSKVMFVGPSTRPDADLESLFAQVSPTGPVVDWAGNCGNISAAVSAYALDEGMLHRSGDHAVVRVRNLNTDSLLELSHPLVDGRLADASARIDVRFLHPGGEKTGEIFPCGRMSVIDGVEVTLIDVANPVVIARAADLPDVSLERLETLRTAAGRVMGIPDSPAIPRVALVEPAGGRLRVRMTSLGRFHHALPATGILALGAAVALGGTVIDLPPAPEVELIHPKGTVTVSTRVNGDSLEWVALARTARIIMRGEATPPPGFPSAC